jgi:CRP-like cAMP-binding protein
VNLRFLHGLTPSAVDEIVATASPKQFLANAVVISQGQPANRLFLLTKGRARFFFITEGGRKLLVHWIMPGEIFGAGALMAKPFPYVLSAEMIENGAVLIWDRSTIRRKVTKYPRLLENILPIFSDYLIRQIAMHVAQTQRGARERLAQVLVTLSSAMGNQTQGGINLNVTNEDLAAAANITVFTTSRLLSDWQRQGVLVKSRRKISLISPERLFSREV